MRGCAACGYLSLGDGDVCLHCGAAAVAPAPAAAQLVGVGAARSIPAAPRAVPPPPPPPPPPPDDFGYCVRITALPDESRAGFGDPAPAPARGRSRGPRRALVLLLVLGVAGFGARQYFFADDDVPAGTEAFVAGDGLVYTPPTADFSVELPTQPAETDHVLTAGAFTATLRMAQVQTDEYEIVAASIAVPPAVLAGDPQRLLHEVLAQGAAAEGGELGDEHAVTYGTVSGVEADLGVDDGFAARVTVLSDADHVYLLGVHSKVGATTLHRALLRSFQPL